MARLAEGGAIPGARFVDPNVLARIGKLPSPAPDFLRRVLAMDAAARYPSARVFAQDLTPSATMVKGQLAEMLRALFAP